MTNSPSFVSIVTFEPSVIFPAMRSRPIRVSTSRWRNRFSGRAPYTGS